MGNVLLYDHWIEKIKAKELLERARMGEVKVNTWRGWYGITLAATGSKDEAEDVANEWALDVMREGGKPNV